MSVQKEIEIAARRFAEFHGQMAQYLDEIKLARAGYRVGRLFDLTYGVVEKGREVVYQHEFERPPCLAATFDGRNALILAGDWRFTRRGFEG